MIPARWRRADRGRRPGTSLERAFRAFDTDADGRLSAEELGDRKLLERLDTDGDGFVSRTEAARRYAGGDGALFQRVMGTGFTHIEEGTNGFAVADLNRDGRLDLVATYSRPRSGRRRRGEDRLRVFLNRGAFRFEEHGIEIEGGLTPEHFGRSAQVPNLADFDGDGFLDLLVTRHAPMLGGKVRPGVELSGNTLLLSNGAFDRFRDASAGLALRNERGYNRQSSLGDVDRDGRLDVALGCDNIGNALGGFPHSRLYVYRPAERRFEDLGGTDLVPDFGGFFHDKDRDRAGPGITLRDLDNDGDLDLLQTYHADVRAPLLPYCPGEYVQGVFCWRNRLVESGELRFERVRDNGLAVAGRLRYDRELQRYVPVAKAPGLPYVAVADTDNDGDLDILAVGPSDSGWSPRAEDVGARFWRNVGDFRFEEATAAVGLDALNRSYRGWYALFERPVSDLHRDWKPRSPTYDSQPGLERRNPIDNRPYYADAVFGDFDNDGWVDLVVLDRRESPGIESRAILFLNRGDGTFEPQPESFSGLDASGISGEAADLDGDGLLDLVFAADPDNSGWARGRDRYRDRVYRNAGPRENHWLRLRFSGAPDAAIIGARVEAFAGDRLLGMRAVHSNHTYKSGGALEAHFGLGRTGRVDVRVTLLDGRRVELEDVAADRFLDLDLGSGRARVVE
jgi:Ca2+-binding EF-hand superfamily protein